MKLIKLSIFLFSVSASISAQNYVGFTSDNYSGVHAVTANPANVVDSRLKVDINLASLSSYIGNDYASLNLFDSLDSDYDFEDDAKLDLTNDNNGLANIDVLGPSFMFSLNAKNAIAITTRARFFTSINNLDGGAVDLISEGINEDTPIRVNDINASGTAHVWSEIGATYGRVLFDNQKHFIKAGITAKYLQGHGYAAITTNNASLDYQPLLITPPSTATGSVTGTGNAEYSYSGNFDKNRDGEAFDDDDDDFDVTAETSGIGFDFGAVYEFRPNSEEFHTTKDGKRIPLKFKNKYLLKVGLSITDIGSLSYKDAFNNIYDLNTTLSVDEIENGDFEGVGGIEEKLRPIESVGKRKIKLPAAMHLNVDWNAYKKLYVNLNTDLSLINQDAKNATRIANNVSITPRFESKWLSIYSPISFRQYGGVIWGAGLRAGPLFLGSGSILTNLISDESKTADVYLGLKIPVYYNKLRDKDGDGIVDKYDECPKEPGTVENNGCPEPEVIEEDVEEIIEADTDNDGIVDSLDKCPNEPGITLNNGCPEVIEPDTDNDGTIDSLDKCPNEPGTSVNNGCPEIKELILESTEAKEVEKTISSYAKTINFNSGKTSFTKGTLPSLEAILEIMNEYPKAVFLIEGYTDSVGPNTSNQQLSESRALAVKAYFIDKGVTASRLNASGFGEENPIATNATPQGRKQNRRVEVKLSK